MFVVLLTRHSSSVSRVSSFGLYDVGEIYRTVFNLNGFAILRGLNLNYKYF